MNNRYYANEALDLYHSLKKAIWENMPDYDDECLIYPTEYDEWFNNVLNSLVSKDYREHLELLSFDSDCYDKHVDYGQMYLTLIQISLDDVIDTLEKHDIYDKKTTD